MSLSSYIRRQSRVTRRSTVVSSAGLSSILEEPESSTEKNSKKNSTKAKRRLGVSDLSIPQTSPLFTAVQGLDDAEWRLRLPLEDAKEDATFDFPRPPLPIFEPISDESESSGSESGEGSSSASESPMSSLPTTPTPSPTAESYDATELQGQCVIRCKSIKPLTITKRSVSPIPPVPSSSALPPCSVSPPSPHAADEEDAWQDDDEYYTAHASNFITLTAPLPPSFPISAASPTVSTGRASRRESAIIPPSSTAAAPIRPSGQLDPTYTPQRASVRLSRPISIPSRAPPPPPIITSGCHVRSGSAPAQTPALPERPSRPPPRTPVPMDAVSTPWSGDYTAYAPLFTPSPSASSSSSSSRLAALLSPPPQHFPAETQGVPCDVDEDDGDWEECAYEYDEVPLSPLIASAPSPESDELSPELEATEPAVEEGEKWTFPPSPLPVPGPYTGWHPRPRASQLRLAVEPLLTAANSPSPLSASPQQDRIPPRTPALRSQWSSSTLSSIHSAHARSPASPKTFSFARRYFPKAKSPSSKSPRMHPKPMGSATILSPKKRSKGNGKRLTVHDVLIIGPPPAPTTPFCALSPATPYSASAQWAAYPASPAPAPAPCLANAGATLTRSPALYAAYTTQRSPRRRASTSSDWSYSSSSNGSSGNSDSGHSDASTGSAGLKRKPIPMEMFLRK
ncbi:hypothetical protein DFH06DRAFT_139978 [Mycena polygramma]|nr:hypothetical protein DFH06DRAFT_139978 [Mycena polygramma]